MGQGGWVSAGYWTASYFVLLTGQQYWAVLLEVLLIINYLYFSVVYTIGANLTGQHGLPGEFEFEAKLKLDNMGC